MVRETSVATTATGEDNGTQAFAALNAAIADVPPNRVAGAILITDGVETCQGDPGAEAEALAKRVKGLRAVEVVGVGLKTGAEKAAVSLIARRGRGKFHDAATAVGLERAIANATAVPIAKKAETPAAAEEAPAEKQ